jgi:curved DNA-binding protein CbpA
LAEDPEEKAKWEEAKREYDEYQNQMDDSTAQEVAILNDAQRAELKALYKKTALMCHPDKVSEELREMAEQIFKELNEANGKNDINRVREIHDDLLKQKFQSRSDTVNEYDKLVVVRISLHSKQKALLHELHTMKETETYQTIMGIEDWDSYFQRTKEALEEQLNNLLEQTPMR